MFRLPDTAPDLAPQEVKTATLGIGSAAQQAIIREIICGMEHVDYAIRERAAVEFALTEALANAFEHGCGHDPQKAVRLSYEIDDARVWIRVADEGPGFAADQVPNPTSPENLSRTSGRGLFLIRKFMDEVEHNDDGNVVTMVKFRSAAGSS